MIHISQKILAEFLACQDETQYVHQICKQHFGSAEYLVYRIFFCNTEHRLISCQQGKNIKSHFSIRNSLEIAFVNEEIGLVILKGLNKMVGQRRGS